jgi:hypothetical protein
MYFVIQNKGVYEARKEVVMCNSTNYLFTLNLILYEYK